MQFDLDQLDSGGKSFTHAYADGELSLADTEVNRLTEQARVEGRIRLRRNRVELRGHLSTKVEMSCDRCLRPVEVLIETNFDVAYARSEALEGNDQTAHELTADDLDVGELTGETFDLDEFVREQILVSVPGRVLCLEDCKGLCLDCGADLNETSCQCAENKIDPRWSALAALREKKS